MKHLEVKQLKGDLEFLIQHLIEKGITSFYVNYALNRNLTKLDTAIREIDATINPRLKELEQKAFTLGEQNFVAGLEKLSPEEQAERESLFDVYLKDMEGENDFQPFRINPEKCEGVDIEFRFMPILAKFFYED